MLGAGSNDGLGCPTSAPLAVERICAQLFRVLKACVHLGSVLSLQKPTNDRKAPKAGKLRQIQVASASPHPTSDAQPKELVDVELGSS